MSGFFPEVPREFGHAIGKFFVAWGRDQHAMAVRAQQSQIACPAAKRTTFGSCGWKSISGLMGLQGRFKIGDWRVASSQAKST
jgi:hypothetical protein